MKREEKNQQTRRKIMDRALAEFSEKGYGASSVNSICAGEEISKGIIYHYFKTKDDLFLACTEECFQLLTEYLRSHVQLEEGTLRGRLEQYFTARLSFFREHPLYQRLFCDVSIAPPAHLKQQIRQRKQDFDNLNLEILERLLEPVTLRRNITRAEVIDTFRQFQDFINARCQMAESDALEFEAHEKNCRRALDILLYGIIERKENGNV